MKCRCQKSRTWSGGGRAPRAVIRGYEITSSKIRSAVKRGLKKRRIPDLEGRRQYYVEVEGAPIPVKWVISEATRMRPSDFVSTEAQRVLVPVKWLIKEATGIRHAEFGLNDAIGVLIRLGFLVKKFDSNSSED